MLVKNTILKRKTTKKSRSMDADNDQKNFGKDPNLDKILKYQSLINKNAKKLQPLLREARGLMGVMLQTYYPAISALADRVSKDYSSLIGNSWKQGAKEAMNELSKLHFAINTAEKFVMSETIYDPRQG